MLDSSQQLVPEWFSDALASVPETGQVRVAQAEIHYRAWGLRGRSGLVLVHGGAAHSRWWDHVAPLLAGERRVVALDLSGHGDSDRRVFENYSLDLWAEETLAVAEDAGIAGKPLIIGHSMGGYVALRTASLFGHQLAGAVVIDSPVRELTPEEIAARQKRAFGPLRVYPTREAILARFRPIPDSTPSLPYVLDHIARNSVRPVPGGWSWKFDPAVFERGPLRPTLTRPDCRIAMFRAQRGLVTEQLGEIMYDKLGRAAPLIEIPFAGHHVMLDQPLSLITGIRTLLADWDHSRQQDPR